MPYYVTQTGSGLGDGSTQANAASVSTFNAETGIPAGDTVYFSGTLTTGVNPSASTNGSSGSPIIFDFSGADSQPAGASALRFSNANDWITVTNISGDGNGDYAFINVDGTSGSNGGATDDITIIFNTPIVNSNNGGGNSNCDGLSLGSSVASSARAIFNNPYVRDCYNSSVLDGGDQAITVHESSRGVFNNVDIANCAVWAVNTESSYCLINGGTMTDALFETISMGGTTTNSHRTIVIDVTMTNNQGAKHPQGTNATDASLLIYGGSYTYTGTTAAQATNRGIVLFDNVTFDLSDPGNTFSYFSSVGGTTLFRNCDFGNISSGLGANAYFLRVDSGRMYLEDCIVDSFTATTGSPYFFTIDGENGNEGAIRGCTLTEMANVNDIVWNRSGVGTSTLYFDDNKITSAATIANVVIDNDAAVETFNRNLIVNRSSVVVGTAPVEAYGNNGVDSATLATLGGVDLTSEEVDVDAILAASAPSTTSTSGGRRRQIIPNQLGVV